MSERGLEEQIAAATAYDQLFVPALFADWAPRVADAARVRAGQRALDVACGTGALTRLIAARVAPAGSATGLDLAPGMLEVARRVVPDAEFREGRAEALPFDDRAFDVVTSQFGLMFFTDRLAAVREMLRVLRPGGRFAIAVWASLDENPAFADEVALFEQLGGARASDPLRAPFVLGDRGELARLAGGAGATDVEIDVHTGVARFPSIRSLVEADLRGWLPVMGVVLPEAQIARIIAESEVALMRYATDEGMRFATRAWLVSGRRPD